VCGDTFSLLQPSSVNTAGIIHKIYLENFLCHNSLEIAFNEKINFIIGQLHYLLLLFFIYQLKNVLSVFQERMEVARVPFLQVSR